MSGAVRYLWGLAYLLTMALAQTGSAALHAGGILTIMLGLGTAVGSNLNLLVRQSMLKPQLAVSLPSAMPAPAPCPATCRSAARRPPKPTDMPERA